MFLHSLGMGTGPLIETFLFIAGVIVQVLNYQKCKQTGSETGDSSAATYDVMAAVLGILW